MPTTTNWRPVSVVSAKWNGDFHRRTPSLEFGPDAFGTWLRMPPDTIAETLSRQKRSRLRRRRVPQSRRAIERRGAVRRLLPLLVEVGRRSPGFLTPCRTASDAPREERSAGRALVTPTRLSGQVRNSCCAMPPAIGGRSCPVLTGAPLCRPSLSQRWCGGPFR